MTKPIRLIDAALRNAVIKTREACSDPKTQVQVFGNCASDVTGVHGAAFLALSRLEDWPFKRHMLFMASSTLRVMERRLDGPP